MTRHPASICRSGGDWVWRQMDPSCTKNAIVRWGGYQDFEGRCVFPGGKRLRHNVAPPLLFLNRRCIVFAFCRPCACRLYVR
jgi:hypothetical protein